MGEVSKNLGGRPTILTDALIEEIADKVRDGNYVEVAAAYCGISKDSLFAWLRAGRRNRDKKDLTEDEKRQVRFSYSISTADAQAEINDIRKIKDEGGWKGSEFRLSRKHMGRWGKVDKLEVSGPNGGAIKIAEEYDMTLLTIPERETLLKLMEKAKREPLTIEGDVE